MRDYKLSKLFGKRVVYKGSYHGGNYLRTDKALVFGDFDMGCCYPDSKAFRFYLNILHYAIRCNQGEKVQPSVIHPLKEGEDDYIWLVGKNSQALSSRKFYNYFSKPLHDFYIFKSHKFLNATIGVVKKGELIGCYGREKED